MPDRSRELEETIDAPKPDPALARIVAPAPAFDATLRVDDTLVDDTARSPLVRVEPAASGTTRGRYQLESEVGEGGLGRILAAHDAVLDRTVAVKELVHLGQDARERFDREIHLTARLQHPSIVPIYDAGRSDDDAPFYAMKLVGGRPLADRIEAARTLEDRLGLLPNVLAVADAIAFAHGEGVVHRDLKPQNVLLGTHGETVVIDWGIAKELGPQRPGARPPTAAGALLGTPAYMAPEQASGLSIDERADVYALGAMLYHVVAGVGPHDGSSLGDMLDRIRRGAIVPLARKEPRVPAELAAIVEKAMTTNPEGRYRDGGAFADDLRRFMTDGLVRAHRATLFYRARRWIRRNAWIAAAAALLVAFALWSIAGLRRERAVAVEAARLELQLAVSGIGRDVAFSLDQADPMLSSLRAVADPALPLAEVAPRLHDLVVGRPGVANVSVGFPSGLFRGSFVAEPTGEIEIQESVVGDKQTVRKNYRVGAGALALVDEVVTDYDVRKRPHYELAARTKARVWTSPRTYFTRRTTGVTCAEPIYGADGALRAVATVDFDVPSLSAFLARPPLEGARSVVFAADGSVLAFPSRPVPESAIREARVLRHEDFRDPALDALLVEVGAAHPSEPRIFELSAGGEPYWVAVAPVGGRRAGVAAPLDWYVATLAPASALLGAAAARERRAYAGLGAVCLAVVVLGFGVHLARRRGSARRARPG